MLTDTWTYSSAMDFAMLIADNDFDIIIGQPSGNLPDGYGDCLFPNAKFRAFHRRFLQEMEPC